MTAQTAHPASKYGGYSQDDYLTPYAKFYREAVAPAPPPVREALQKCPFPAGAIPPFEQIADLSLPGYQAVETGFTLEADGSQRLAILTPMPAVSPKMWDWWFGWHGCADNRYKLWHPKAHRSARWQDGGSEVAYVGRVSMIQEFIGKSLEKANVAFRSPAELGFPAASFSDKNKAVFICARVGYTNLPLDYGWLVHQIRATENGSEMRSRFFIGGGHVQLRWRGAAADFLSKILQKSARLPERQARDLLTHCSEEMNHLATFLPRLFAAQNQVI